MTDPAGPEIAFVLDASAVAAFGHSEHVGEMIIYLGDEPGQVCFGVSPLALAAAWSAAADKAATDLIVALTHHPRYRSLPLTGGQVLRTTAPGADADGDSDAGGFVGGGGFVGAGGDVDAVWAAWSHLGAADRIHSMILALDLECQILSAAAGDYAMPGITIAIPANGEDWPDEPGYWPL